MKTPKAVFLMKWTAKRGPVIQGSYPPDAEIEKNFLIDVLGSIIQEGEERREGFYPITLEGKDVVTYYSGQERNQVFGILLEEREQGKDYRGGIVQATVRVLKKGGTISTTSEWKDLWNWITAYPEMTRAQRIGDAFTDETIQEVFSLLEDNGILTREEVVDRTQISLPGLSRDVITTYIHILEALGILDAKWDEEALEERVQILRNVFFSRKKPENFEEIAGEIPQYKKEFASYLEKYKRERMWQRDQEILPEFLSKPEVYRLIERFRRQGVIPKEELPEELNEEIDRLIEVRILGETEEEVFLFISPTVDLLYPRYTISRVFANARDETLTKARVVEFLNTLKASYL